MSAYNRAELSVEAYLVRILAALCRQSGGELRVKGELVDMIGESTTLTKYWDSEKQEVVIRASLGMFTEVFRVIPEKQTPKAEQPRPADPLARTFAEQTAPVNGPDKEFLPRGSTLDDPRLSELEKKRNLARAAQMIRDELQRREKDRIRNQERTL